jgi:hypothetical protein
MPSSFSQRIDKYELQANTGSYRDRHSGVTSKNDGSGGEHNLYRLKDPRQK